MPINKKVQEEMRQLARSSSLRHDMQKLAETRHNPFLLPNGEVDIDKYIIFLNEYNSFINHKPKPFRKMIDKVMKL